ncbi:hypothetical protein ACJJTC_003569 [Scirpophaga incertulas]
MLFSAAFVILNFLDAIIGGDVEYDYVTEFGKVRGQVADDGDYLTFLGVPYAAPPIGQNRFKAPQPLSPWKETVYHANRTVKCPQKGEGDEDCLIVNIFTPTKQATELYPVLIYIHGGGFLHGSGPVKGVEPLIKQNIIVVTFNYRLGSLGFLCLGTVDAPGNAGLKDQTAALEWVHRNIANFGGDPHKVTIYGMSAGAASAEYHVLLNSNRELFRYAVIESGSATSMWAFDPFPVDNAIKLAKYLGMHSDGSVSEVVDFYRSLPAEPLSKANWDYYQNLTDGSIGIGPCIEKSLEQVQPFMTRAPSEVLKTHEYASRPLLFIFTSLEGLFLRSNQYTDYIKNMDANFADYLPADLAFDNDNIKNDVANNVKQFYFNNNYISSDSIMEYFYLFGDYMILNGVFNSVKGHVANNDNSSIYLMEFAYKGNLGSYNKAYDSLNLSGHGDAIKHTILKKPLLDIEDNIAVERMSALIGNFVKYGNPTPSQSAHIPTIWPPILSEQNLTYLHFDKNLSVRYQLDNSLKNRLEFWEQLYEMYRRTTSFVHSEEDVTSII